MYQNISTQDGNVNNRGNSRKNKRIWDYASGHTRDESILYIHIHNGSTSIIKDKINLKF